MSDFTVCDEASAAWAVDKILAARERAARIRANCEEMIADAENEARRTEEYLGSLVQAWAVDNLPRDKKSIKLSTGKIQFRTVAGGPRVVDKDALIAWATAENYKNLLRVKEVVSVDAGAVEEFIKSAGELPPGVEFVEGRETFSVKA